MSRRCSLLPPVFSILLALIATGCAGDSDPGRVQESAPTTPAEGGNPSRFVVLLGPGVDPFDFAAEHDLTVISVTEDDLALMEGTASLSSLLADPDAMEIQLDETAILGGSINMLMGFTESGWVEDSYPDQSAFDCLDLDFVHQRGQGDGVRVGLIDTGVAKFHPHLLGRIEVFPVPILGQPWETSNPSSDFGHGTHVAGTILTVAPDATIVPFKVLDSQGTITAFAVAAALEGCIKAEVDIVNISLRLSSESTVIEELIERLIADGVPVVVAAGNNLPDDAPGFPASIPNVIAVSATGLVVPDPPGSAPSTCSELADFSAFDDELVEYAAIGEEITSSYPGPNGVHRLATATGTSSAAGVVTGCFALVMGTSTPALRYEDPFQNIELGLVPMPGVVALGRISPADIFDE